MDHPYFFAAEIDDDDALSLAEKRDAEMERGDVEPLSHDELMRRLRPLFQS